MDFLRHASASIMTLSVQYFFVYKATRILLKWEGADLLRLSPGSVTLLQLMRDQALQKNNGSPQPGSHN